jgi:hypothetical protein
MAKQKYLTLSEEASYVRFEAQSTDQTMLERFFFLDDADLDLVAKGGVIIIASGSVSSW